MRDSNKLKQVVQKVRKTRTINIVTASIWTVAALFMWMTVVYHNQNMLSAAIPFTGIAFMFWMLSIDASSKYAAAVKELSRYSS